MKKFRACISLLILEIAYIKYKNDLSCRLDIPHDREWYWPSVSAMHRIKKLQEKYEDEL